MPPIPVQFFTWLILLVFLLMLSTYDHQRYRSVLYFLFACVLLLTVSMLRAAYPSAQLMWFRVLLAALIPVLVLRCFYKLTRQKLSFYHCAPAAMALVATQHSSLLTDFTLFVVYSGYAFLLVKVGIQGSDKFIATRLGEAPAAAKMAIVAGFFLFLMGKTDWLSTMEYIWYKSKNMPRLIATMQLIVLPFLSFAILQASRTRPTLEDPRDSDPQFSQQLSEQCQQLEDRLHENALFLDGNLTLNMLARQSGIAEHQILRAVKATHKCSVAQWINGFRITHAQHLLQHSDLSVTDVMLQSGFFTKAHFNREFSRLCGRTPKAFRRRAISSRSPKSQ